MSQPHDPTTKRRERTAFLLVTVVGFPLLTVLLVSAYGFMVWAWQMLVGPPAGH